MARARTIGVFLAVLAVASPSARVAEATPPTPGYPEPVVQWGVQKGETCADIARVLYGSPKLTHLLLRYNHIACKSGVPLREGLTLVLPEAITALPDARLRSLSPDVRARGGGGAWAPASIGMALFSNDNINTLDTGRADIEFVDRTRVFLAPNTLVVLFGTAAQTHVSKTPPAAVELDAGEVKAGLAALRGGSVNVAVKGGGQVSAVSRDTVVQRKGDRTTVEVFDGQANVRNGGKSVAVPSAFGTRFVGTAPPMAPRPLPPAPIWASGADSVTLAPGGYGVIGATWNAVPAAAAYRIELSRDAQFCDLVAREEVPASVTAFRGEKLPVGTYYLAVRAIDQDDYLGVASEVRTVHLVEARVDGVSSTLGTKTLEVNPYSSIRLRSSNDLELSVDDAPFAPMPEVIDLRRRAPRVLRVRGRGASSSDLIPIRYTAVGAAIQTTLNDDRSMALLRVRLTGFEGIDVASRVAPSARVRLPGGLKLVTLLPGKDGELRGSLPWPSELSERVRIDVVDDRGVVLGTTDWLPPAETFLDATKRPPVVGAFAPLWQPSPGANVLWSPPTLPDGATVSASAVSSGGTWGLQGQVRASGSVDAFSIDAALSTPATGASSLASGVGWLGGRVRLVRLDGASFEFGPALRLGFPLSAQGVPGQLEPSVAAGGVSDHWTWLVNFGGRVNMGKDVYLTGTPSAQVFGLAGGTFDLLPWLRLHALLDTHVAFPDHDTAKLLAGLGTGIEGGTWIYGGLALRVSPWPDPGLGPVSAQLSLGFRAWP